ncbi:oxygenase MpaB family protein [Streptomyces griseoluteus]|uniref:oxygenase MpaB family protein n=1 Tax=Streptomyces griseoluteus TaxID=29306 RepID=UPI0027E426D0|nr:oxygenase MpaB family protein [Streptomyces griseoluteus]
MAGPDGPESRRRVHGTPGPRWFAPDRPIRVVHGDASMFPGGLAALLLQSLHPLAMTAVADHSDYRNDPWGRLARTSTFLAYTTYGAADDAQRAVDRVRAVHENIRGHTPDGEPYHAADPHLLAWVHSAEAYCFLTAHQRYGRHPLNAAGRDAYVADMARVATALGIENPPATVAELHTTLNTYRPELRLTPQTREAVHYILLRPPLPKPVLPPYLLLGAAAASLLPGWSRQQLDLPVLPRTERWCVAPAGAAVTALIRHLLPPPPPPHC